MGELLPCPHCAGPGHEWQDGSVWCLKCEATAPDAETWNTRVFLGAGNVSSEKPASVDKPDAP